VYEFLAQAYREKGDKANEMAQLEAYSRVGGRSPSSLKTLANLQTDAGKKKEADAGHGTVSYLLNHKQKYGAKGTSPVGQAGSLPRQVSGRKPAKHRHERGLC